MKYIALVDEVKKDNLDELKVMAKRKLSLKMKEIDAARLVLSKLEKQYDELLEKSIADDLSETHTNGWINTDTGSLSNVR